MLFQTEAQINELIRLLSDISSKNLKCFQLNEEMKEALILSPYAVRITGYIQIFMLIFEVIITLNLFLC